jgi:hypothetical protein
MLTFSGYLSSYARRDGSVVVRFLSGDINPSPSELPVLEVTLPDEPSIAATIATLEALKDEDSWLYLYVSSDAPLQIETEHGQEFTLGSNSPSVQQLEYASDDYQHLAQCHYESSLNQHAKISGYQSRLARLREIIDNQRAKLEIKMVGHADGSTARTLYEQQISFLARIRAETEA